MRTVMKFENTYYKSLWRILDSFKRDELRELAREFNVPIGRNKSDTIASIVKHRGRFKLNIVIGIERR